MPPTEEDTELAFAAPAKAIAESAAAARRVDFVVIFWGPPRETVMWT
jgi:hypothetical protein